MAFPTRWLLLISTALAPALSFAAVASTDFVVAPDKTSFSPAAPFRNGDRLQVQSPHLDFDDIVALGRCLDANCEKLDIVRAWNAGHRHRFSDYVNIQQDGDYVFFGSRIPWTLPAIEGQGCRRSVPLNKVCSQSVRLSIRQALRSPDAYRVQFSTDSWFWVRKIRAAE